MIYFKIANKTFKAKNLTEARKVSREMLEVIRKNSNLHYGVYFYTKLADTESKKSHPKAVMDYMTWEGKYSYFDGKKHYYVNKNGTLGNEIRRF